MSAYIGKERPVAPIETFLDFHDFHSFSKIFVGCYHFSLIDMYFHSFSSIFMDFGTWVLTSVRSDLLPLYKPLVDSRLASCPLRSSIVLFRFSLGMHQAGWIIWYNLVCSKKRTLFNAGSLKHGSGAGSILVNWIIDSETVQRLVESYFMINYIISIYNENIRNL